jgi:HEAT repeat protein
MTKTTPFQAVLDALLDDSQPLPQHILYQFSDIEPAQLKLLLKIWPQVSLARQRILLDDLEALTEEDALLYFDDLARALLDDPDAHVRAQAIRLLWESEDAKLARKFLEMLNSDGAAEVRAAAATALGMFVYLGEIEEIPEAILHEIEEGLLAAVKSDKGELVRRRALEALGWSSRPELPDLIEAAYREKSPYWKVSALFAMGRSSGERWNKYVLSNLRSSNETIRTEAMRAAGQMSLASAAPILLDMLADEEEVDIRHEIIWSLSKIGGEDVRERFEELLNMEMDKEEAALLEGALEELDFTDMVSGEEEFDLFDFEDDEE